MVKAKNNKLTLDEVLKSDSQYDELKKVEFDGGKYTEVYVKFRPSKIEALIEDFAKFSVDLTNAGIEFTESNSSNYLMLYAVQYFSTLVPDYPTDIHEKLDIFNKMFDSEVVEKVISSFDPAELAKIILKMFKKIESYQKMFEANKDLKDQFLTKIKGTKHAELIESLFVNGEQDAEPVQQSE